MPISLAAVAANIASVTLYVGEDTLTVVYYPNKITDETIAQLASVERITQDTQSGLKSLNELLCQLVKSWDFYEDEAQTTMVPLTLDRLTTVPLFLKSKISLAIMEDMRPNETTPQTVKR